MLRLLGSLALLAAFAVGVESKLAYDHDKIVSCYYSSWAYYR